MQDIGSAEDMRRKERNTTLRSRESSVESLGHCQPVGNWIALVCKSILPMTSFTAKTLYQRADTILRPQALAPSFRRFCLS